MRVRDLVLHIAAPALGVTIVGVAVLLGPWSPLALDGANARYAAGDLDGAVSRYEAVATSWQTPTTRAEAWRRAGMIRRSQGDVRGAVRDFEHAVELAPEARVRADTFTELGLLYKDELKDSRSCAESFEQAAIDSATGEEDLAAAGCWLQAGDKPRAEAALLRAAGREPIREQAEKALATLDAPTAIVADGAE